MLLTMVACVVPEASCTEDGGMMRAPCDGEAAGAAAQAVPPAVVLALDVAVVLDVAVELDVAADEMVAQALEVGKAGRVDGTVGAVPPGEVDPVAGCVAVVC